MLQNVFENMKKFANICYIYLFMAKMTAATNMSYKFALEKSLKITLINLC